MSIEQTLIAQARPAILAAAMHSLMGREVAKGCQPELWAEPVALEPPYQPIVPHRQDTDQGNAEQMLIEDPPAESDLVRLRVWPSPDQKFDWKRNELFLKQLLFVSHRLSWEIIGNQRGITLGLTCHRSDEPIVLTAFQGEFEHCRLSGLPGHPLRAFPASAWDHALFRDYFPPPPYSHLLTRPEELEISPYESLLAALSQIPDPAAGLLQVLFQPVRPDHNWHRNVQILLDLEYMAKLIQGVP